MTAPPLALYIHFPWCVSKCPYCDFNSHAVQGALPAARYLAALAADLDVQAPIVAGRTITSVFLGGGTPSLFAPGDIARVLEHARNRLAFAPDAEITLEANPGTIERGRFAGYRDAGVNRVSLGAQSFDHATLAALGRIHSPDETRRAAEELHAAGLGNFNLDLMYALPAQNCEGALADIDAALALAPAHVSHYQLTLEPGTLFAARPPALPDDDTALAMLEACRERLAGHGFTRYEVSAYARTARRCRHNLNYWEFGDYLGVGAGAHGKMTGVAADSGTPRITRTTRPREPRRYMSAAGDPPEARAIAARELPFEFLLNALRLCEGFSPTLFEARTGLAWATLTSSLVRLVERGLLECTPERCRPTARGLDFLNDLLLEFVPESRAGAAG
ncbi:MAG: Oxygen-independent coproporphyrinogen-III oxidase-like protein [Steroidobacteraceae bacterium]|nr:Oxygen-independent coproporphyrinogen-III oxidase-like protein [Steroidobacteraceae bacterium]